MDLITLAMMMQQTGSGGSDVEEIQRMLAPYATKAAMNAALTGKADVSALASYATLSAVTQLIASSIAEIVRFEYYLCEEGEYDPQTEEPTVQAPDVNHIYLVPTSGENLLMYAYINSAFVFLGTTEMDLSGYVTDADLNNTLDDYATLAALQAVSAAMPTKVSDLTNDAGYLTQHQDISGKANTADLSDAAFSGSYNDLSNKPTIPTIPANLVVGSTKAYTIVVSNSAPAAGTADNVITFVPKQ